MGCNAASRTTPPPLAPTSQHANLPACTPLGSHCRPTREAPHLPRDPASHTPVCQHQHCRTPQRQSPPAQPGHHSSLPRLPPLPTARTCLPHTIQVPVHRPQGTPLHRKCLCTEWPPSGYATRCRHLQVPVHLPSAVKQMRCLPLSSAVERMRHARHCCTTVQARCWPGLPDYGLGFQGRVHANV